MLALAFRFVLATLRFTPLPLAFRLGHFYAILFDLAVPKLRKVARRNLEIAGYGKREDLIDGVFRSIGRILVFLARFPDLNRSNIRQHIQYEGFEHFEHLKAQGKGVLFATAHLGNWELSAFAHALMAEPMNVMVRPLDNAAVDAVVEHRRAMSGNRIVTKKDAIRDVLRALRANEAVGMLIDQNALPEEGMFLDFFGLQASAHTGLIRLAHRTGAGVIPGFAVWSESRKQYTLKFYPPVEMTGDLSVDSQRVHTAIERAIREYPDQWIWLHKRWKSRPAGEPELY